LVIPHLPLSLGYFSGSISRVILLFYYFILRAFESPWTPVSQFLDYLHLKYSSGMKLKFGVMNWDGNILPQPPVRWAIQRFEKHLYAAGYEIILWRIDQKRTLKLLVRAHYV
jgi:hypothetical protein